MKIPLFKPSITQEEIDEVVDTLKSGWIGLGPKVAKFEKAFAKYIGAKYAIGTSSCTAALKIALAATKQEKKEVITTPMTFISTPHVVVHIGKIPIFADVLWKTINLNPDAIRRRLSKETWAIIPVHYGGHPCRMDEINRIAKENNLVVIEDCAHACGAEYKGKKIGKKNIGCFSFHPVKNLATGDGGMITTSNKEFYQKMLKLRWLGIDKSTYRRNLRKYQWKYSVEYFGYKGHMNDITASLGLVQLKRLDSMNQARRKIAEEYTRAFEDLRRIGLPEENKDVKSSWHFYPIKHPEREKLRMYLAKKGISTGVHYLPAFRHPVYEGKGEDCPIASQVWKWLLSLPLYPDMTKEELEYVIKTIKEFKS